MAFDYIVKAVLEEGPEWETFKENMQEWFPRALPIRWTLNRATTPVMVTLYHNQDAESLRWWCDVQQEDKHLILTRSDVETESITVKHAVKKRDFLNQHKGKLLLSDKPVFDQKIGLGGLYYIIKFYLDLKKELAVKKSRKLPKLSTEEINEYLLYLNDKTYDFGYPVAAMACPILLENQKTLRKLARLTDKQRLFKARSRTLIEDNASLSDDALHKELLAIISQIKSIKVINPLLAGTKVAFIGVVMGMVLGMIFLFVTHYTTILPVVIGAGIGFLSFAVIGFISALAANRNEVEEIETLIEKLYSLLSSGQSKL